MATNTLLWFWELGIPSLLQILSASVIGCCPGERLSTCLFWLLIVAIRLEQLTLASCKLPLGTILLRSHRPGLAPIIPPVPCYMTLKIGPCYPGVDNPLAQGTQVYHLDTRHLYHSEPSPISILLSRHHFELMSSKFARPLSIGAAYEWSGG